MGNRCGLWWLQSSTQLLRYLLTEVLVDRGAGYTIPVWCRQLLEVGVKFFQVGLEMLDGLGCQRDHPCSVAFAGQRYTSGLSEHEVLERETGEFADSGGGVVEQDQQHPIAPGFRRGACMSGQDGSG